MTVIRVDLEQPFHCLTEWFLFRTHGSTRLGLEYSMLDRMYNQQISERLTIFLSPLSKSQPWLNPRYLM